MSIRIIEGDARELRGVDPESVDLVVTSPPYPMIPQWDLLFDSVGATDFERMHEWLRPAWAATYRALIPGGILAINIGDALRTRDGEFRLWPNHARILSDAESLGFRPLPYILWKKPMNRPNAFLGSGFLPPNAYVTLDCEYILLFRKGRLRILPPRDERRQASQYSKAERDLWFSQVWDRIPGVRQGPGEKRTAAFPPEIPRRLIRMFSRLGDTVLDPFAGTGTTLWAANTLGRLAIGVERDAQLADLLRTQAARIGRDLTPEAGSNPRHDGIDVRESRHTPRAALRPPRRR